MKLFNILFGVLTLVTTANSQAALVSVNASADMTSGHALATSLLPIGTTVTSDVTFNIGAGTIQSAPIDNVSGTFSWVDGTFGAQVFNAESAFLTLTHSGGWFFLEIAGSGPTIHGITAESFGIRFNIATNPFTPPGSTAELFDLTLNGSIDALGVFAREGNLLGGGDLSSNVSGSISAVPAPGALVLFISGLLGISALRSSRSKKP